jgi:hypothetical protein
MLIRRTPAAIWKPINVSNELRTDVYDMSTYHPKANKVYDIECTITAFGILRADIKGQQTHLMW